jgi:hypothetical protein
MIVQTKSFSAIACVPRKLQPLIVIRHPERSIGSAAGEGSEGARTSIYYQCAKSFGVME